MDVLIVYGTTEGQTRKIADWTARHVRGREHHVELRDSTALMSDLDLKTFHGFIIAASVHHSTIKTPLQTSPLRITGC